MLGAAAEVILWYAWLRNPPVTSGDVVAFGFFQWAPLLLWLGGGLSALARTRPWWGREIEGSVYRDHRSFFRHRRYDLARIGDVRVRTSSDEHGPRFHLGFRPPGEQARTSIQLPVHADQAQVCSERERRLLLALADALTDSLAGHSEPEATGRAVADLRFLAGASGQETGRWLAEEARVRKAEAQARKAAASS